MFKMGLFELILFLFSVSIVFSSNTDPPQLNRDSLSNVSTVVGKFQVFMCSINSGSEPVSFTFLHNGKPITEEPSSVKIDNVNSKVSMLTLQQIRRSDSGVYSCIAKNRYGSDSATWTLKVNGNVFCFKALIKCGARFLLVFYNFAFKSLYFLVIFAQLRICFLTASQ